MIGRKKIVIIGGGPGGLTLARLLQMKGADVSVLERDAHRDVRVQGATLDLHEASGLEALRRAGLMDAFISCYRPGAERIRIADEHAAIRYDEHQEAPANDFGGKYARPEIDRGPLRNILLDSLQPGTVVWDSHFVSLEPCGEGWKINCRNGSVTLADIVIGADGARSGVRPFVTPVTAFYTGYTAIEGTVYDAATTAPLLHAMVNGGKIFALGGSKTLIVSAKGDGSLAFYPCFETSESWMKDCGIDFTDARQVAGWFKEEYAGWSSAWQELFDNDKVTFIPRPLYCMPPDQSWEAKPNITLIGDAAHVMPPYAGEGVNMAMQDAFELAAHLTGSDSPGIRTAIEMYEQQMRVRAAKAARMSMQSMEAMHSPGGLSWLLDMFNEMGVAS